MTACAEHTKKYFQDHFVCGRSIGISVWTLNFEGDGGTLNNIWQYIVFYFRNFSLAAHVSTFAISFMLSEDTYKNKTQVKLFILTSVFVFQDFGKHQHQLVDSLLPSNYSTSLPQICHPCSPAINNILKTTTFNKM